MPKSIEIREHRVRHRITQKKAAKMILVHLRTWQRWEKGESKMPESMFEYFKIITTQ